MNPAEIIVGEVKAVCGPQVLPLLAEAKREPGEPSHLHSDRQILSLNMAGADSFRIGVAHDWDLLRVRDLGRTVLAFAFGILRIDFDNLREVATVSKRRGNGRFVRNESIGRDLEALGRSRQPQPFNKGVRGGLGATAQREVENEFGASLHGDEAICIAL